MPTFSSPQEVFLYALAALIALFVTTFTVWHLSIRLTIKNHAKRESIANAALEGDTQSDNLVREFAATWSAELATLRVERDALKDTISQQALKLAEQSLSIRHLEAWKATAEEDNKENQQRIKEQSQLIEQQSAQIKSLIEQDKARQQEIAEIRQHWQATLSTLAEVRNTADEQRRQLEAAQTTEKGLRDEMNEISDSLAAAQIHNARLVEEINTLKDKVKQLEQENKGHVQQIAQLKSQLEDCLARPLPAAEPAASADSQPATSDGAGDGQPDSGGDGSTGANSGDDSGRHPAT